LWCPFKLINLILKLNANELHKLSRNNALVGVKSHAI
jgi:hypothetical protein